MVSRDLLLLLAGKVLVLILVRATLMGLMIKTCAEAALIPAVKLQAVSNAPGRDFSVVLPLSLRACSWLGGYWGWAGLSMSHHGGEGLSKLPLKERVEEEEDKT